MTDPAALNSSSVFFRLTLWLVEDGPRGAELPGQPVETLRCVSTGGASLAQWPSHRFCLWVLSCRALQSPGGDHHLHQPRGHPVHQVCFLPRRVGHVPGAAGSRFSPLGLPSRERQLQPDRGRIPLEPSGLPSQRQPLCPLWLSKRQQLGARTAHRQQAGALLGCREESAVCGRALPFTEEQLWLWHVRYLYRRGLVWEGERGGLATPSRANHHPGLHHPEEGRLVQADPGSGSERPLLLAVSSLARPPSEHAEQLSAASYLPLEPLNALHEYSIKLYMKDISIKLYHTPYHDKL